MIIQLVGNVKYPITLDSSVWIFDDRKIIFDDAFSLDNNEAQNSETEDYSDRFNEMYSLEVYQQKIKPPVNKSINKYEKEKILTNTYVMPIKPFIKNAEIAPEATIAQLHTVNGEIEITKEQFINSFLLFAVDGKPVKDEGPVHLYFKDGSNKDSPIKGINKVTFK